jgi:putative sterol carrier protein
LLLQSTAVKHVIACGSAAPAGTSSLCVADPLDARATGCYFAFPSFFLYSPTEAMPKYESVDELLRAYPGRFNPEEAKGMDSVVQLDLTGERGGRYYAEVHDQNLNIEEGRHDDPDTTLTTSAENWIKINNGEANPMQLMMQGELKVDGSIPTATKFQGLFE